MELNNEELLLPQCRVFVDGRQIKASEEMIESVSVQLSASQMSNSCEVVIFCDHDHGRSTIGNIISRASAGKKIRVEMGYRLTKPVFMGYINAAGVSFSEDGVTLTLSCLDARGLLMGNTSRESFENSLRIVYAYSSTLSLEKELIPVAPEELAVGDVFIKGGSPGHVVIVVDMAVNKSTGEKRFMLLQGNMPSQQAHIIKNIFEAELSPWFSDSFPQGKLVLATWECSLDNIKRFS